MKSKKRKIQLIFLSLTILIIFLHSLIPPSASSSESGFVTTFLKPILTLILGPKIDLEHFVRKAGHFTEFFLLGLQIFLLKKGTGPFMIQQAKTSKEISSKALFRGFQDPVVSLMASWIIAFFDETLQIFSGRGPMIQDVWLDVSGALCGILIFWLFSLRKKADP